MGLVYRAWQVDSVQRQVAIKVLKPSLLKPSEARSRFEREMGLLGQFHHPNVVQVYAAETDAATHRPYIAMEYVEGADLAPVLSMLPGWKSTPDGRSPRGKLRESDLLAALRMAVAGTRSEEGPAARSTPAAPAAGSAGASGGGRGKSYYVRLAELFAGLARGLEHLHGRGVIHRDVKPSNVRLAADGGRAVLMDLGLARSGEPSAMESGPVGTPCYLPPECLDGSTPPLPSTRGDIYSLGVTLYEATALEPAYRGTQAEVLEGIRGHAGPLSPRNPNPAVPRSLGRIVERATQRIPEFRYPTAAAMAEDLERFARGEPVTAPGPFYDLRLFRARHRREVNLAASAIFAFMGLLARFYAPGSLQLETIPEGARIWIDGGHTVLTTPADCVRAWPGPHAIRFVLPDGCEVHQSAIVRPWEATRVPASARLAGYLTLPVYPANATLRFEREGRFHSEHAGSALQVPLCAGAYVARVTAPEYEPQNVDFRIEPELPTILPKVSLQHEMGFVTITSSASGVTGEIYPYEPTPDLPADGRIRDAEGRRPPPPPTLNRSRGSRCPSSRIRFRPVAIAFCGMVVACLACDRLASGSEGDSIDASMSHLRNAGARTSFGNSISPMMRSWEVTFSSTWTETGWQTSAHSTWERGFPCRVLMAIGFWTTRVFATASPLFSAKCRTLIFGVICPSCWRGRGRSHSTFPLSSGFLILALASTHCAYGLAESLFS